MGRTRPATGTSTRNLTRHSFVGEKFLRYSLLTIASLHWSFQVLINPQGAVHDTLIYYVLVYVYTASISNPLSFRKSIPSSADGSELTPQSVGVDMNFTTAIPAAWNHHKSISYFHGILLHQPEKQALQAVQRSRPAASPGEISKFQFQIMSSRRGQVLSSWSCLILQDTVVKTANSRVYESFTLFPNNVRLTVCNRTAFSIPWMPLLGRLRCLEHLRKFAWQMMYRIWWKWKEETSSPKFHYCVLCVCEAVD